jgi:Family of unknown function (DUF6334)
VNDLVREVADNYGSLKSVAGAHTFPPDPGFDSRYGEYVFGFEHGSFTVTAEPSDDTIRLGATGATLPYVTDLSGEEPWSRLIGCGTLWIWQMVNQNGYFDGLQFAFARPGECWEVQLMCEASAFSMSSLGPLERMTNLFE